MVGGWGGRKKRLKRSGLRRFAYRLALKVGHANVDRMLRGMTTRQLTEWRAYADLEPFDEERADYRAASIVHAVRNAFRKKGAPPITLKECVVQFGAEADGAEKPKTVDQSRSQIKRTMDFLVAMFGVK
jgi:hypothetical protein